jgi:hypothetical protein
MWREAFDSAQQAVTELNARIREQCEQAGIPARFAPSAGLGWRERGQNITAGRRTELRRVAQSRVAADTKSAKAEIERRSIEVQTQLVAGGLISDEAKAFLDAMPTVEHLMPTLDIAQIEGEAKPWDAKSELSLRPWER